MSNILVIGGSNIDFVAKSDNKLVFKDSNIGDVNISNGGVGRNIALNLALLNNSVSFITSLGKDILSSNLEKELIKYHIKCFIPKSKFGVGSYLAINDELGEMQLAICDSKFFDNLTYKDLLPFKKIIDNCQDIVLDTNLNEKLIIDIVKNNLDKRFYVDGVSANKVIRLKEVLSHLYLFKSNLIEAETVLSKKNNKKELVKMLLNIGCKNVVITDSYKSISYGNNNEVFEVEPSQIKEEEIINVNGAGDAFFAGFVSSLIKNNNIHEAVDFAKKMSYYTLKSTSSVNLNISNLIIKK